MSTADMPAGRTHGQRCDRTRLTSPALAKLTRRQALRNLGLGIAAGSLASALAACGPSGSGSQSAPATSSEAKPTGPLPGRTPSTPHAADVQFSRPAGVLRGSWAAPPTAPKAGVLVIHDDDGLTPYFTDLVGRFAGAGYGTLCVDLLSPGAGQATPVAPGFAINALERIPPDATLSALRSGINELQKRVPGRKIGVVGFGYGGEQLWSLLAAGETRIAAAVSFYGAAPDNLDLSKAKAAVLALYAKTDEKVTSTQDAADLALTNANLEHNSVFYDNTSHGFFDDTSLAYDPVAAKQAWQATTDWLGHHL